MRIIKTLVIFLISILLFTESANAAPPIANTYKQGIYTGTESGKSNFTAKLLTPNNVTTLIILDSNGNQKFFKKFDNTNESVNIGVQEQLKNI